MSRLVLHVPRINVDQFVFLKDSRTYCANLSDLEAAGFQTGRIYSDLDDQGFCLKTFIGHEIPCVLSQVLTPAHGKHTISEYIPIPELGHGDRIPFSIQIADDRQEKRTA